MGVVECTVLTLEEECNDLVGIVGGGWGLKHDGGLMILAHSVHESISTFQKCCTHPAKCTSLQILQKPVAKFAHGTLEYLSTNKDIDG